MYHLHTYLISKRLLILTWEIRCGIGFRRSCIGKTNRGGLLVRVEALKAKTGRTPILATILVGDDGASATYVRMKGNACRQGNGLT